MLISKSKLLQIIAIVIWALASCQTGATSISQPHKSAIAPLQAKLNQETTMIETLQNLCNVLSNAPLTAQAAATSLGTIVEDQGKDWPVIVQPSNSAFQEARVVRQAGTNEPAHVELTLADPSKLTVKMLREAFGNYSKPPKLHRNRPTKLVFDVDIPNTPRTCAVIADVTPQEHGVEDGIVNSVTLRRDIRLE
ncbi:MAG: hypothetical protein RMX68_029970 [Aulosira sp. ZfuVER01]|nr:hypothetical protein [Aulosira sp. ZfuVER01]MDZ7997783.1 hypothetical protein [Aulosira sp. DedVER01a]MDZ8052278.1 hypothetical protein [Aulosira sp. ZfuCHP01]